MFGGLGAVVSLRLRVLLPMAGFPSFQEFSGLFDLPFCGSLDPFSLHTEGLVDGSSHVQVGRPVPSPPFSLPVGPASCWRA